ncbi:hypothetical protein IW140_003690 [Coemansia sp. RSA 1813]|nr:hypothetical protein EV179_003596 [Coemansia sp. RSA 487]KAJ2568699.1 hypothetical protein IW140_003690 [Coemansia sp. RSA 1813]
MLLEHGVPERLQNLRNICITSGYQSLPSHDGESYFLRFAFGVVSPSTRSFSLLKFRGSYSIVETIASYPAMQNILYLDISDVKLQLTEVIELIQILPNLEYLCYSCGGLGSSLGRVLYKEMPHILHAKYYPLSMRLKCCGINTFKRTPTRSIAVTAMVLAILCPRLTFAKVPSYLITTYNSAIENAIRDEPYLEHSDRLESLLN